MGSFFIYMSLQKRPKPRGRWEAPPFLCPKEVRNIENPQQLECDTPDCTHWEEGGCALPGSVTIQEHHCTDYEERLPLPEATLTIVVEDGRVQTVYASPDLPKIMADVIDLDDMKRDDAVLREHMEYLAKIYKLHTKISD